MGELTVFFSTVGDLNGGIVNETPCRREIEGFYVVFTEDLLVFKSGAPNDCFL